ncbi:MAG: uracil-DNA glycosylase, partial [Brachymonas sp.]|nr:uracil-DNA glycosylase [Brachymonas sp.]
PEAVQWVDTAALNVDMFHAADMQQDLSAAPCDALRFKVPRAFVELGEVACRHSSPQRFALLYRLLWRLVHEPALRHDPLDGDVMQVRK